MPTADKDCHPTKMYLSLEQLPQPISALLVCACGNTVQWETFSHIVTHQGLTTQDCPQGWQWAVHRETYRDV